MPSQLVRLYQGEPYGQQTNKTEYVCKDFPVKAQLSHKFKCPPNEMVIFFFFFF